MIRNVFVVSGFADGADITASLPWSVTKTGTGTAKAKADAVRPGEVGIEFIAPASSGARVSYTETTSSPRVMTFEFLFVAIPTVQSYIQGGIDSTNIGDTRINTDGKVAARNSVNVAFGTSTVALVAGHRYRVSRKYLHNTGTPANGTSEVRVYDADSADPDTPIITLVGPTGSLSVAQHTRLDAGLPTAAPGTTLRTGRKFVISDDWITADTFEKADLGLEYPQYVNHRGMEPGPASTYYTHSQHMLIAGGVPLVDLDVQTLNGVTSDLAVSHDATIDAVASPDSPLKTGEVDTDFTLTQWSDGSVLFGATAPGKRPALFSDIAAMFGPSGSIAPNKVVACEIKTTTSYRAGMDIIERYGMKNQLMMQSFSVPAAYYMAACGYETAFITGDSLPGADGDHPSAAVLAANGINHIFINKDLVTANPSMVAPVHAAGMRLWVYTIFTQAERDAQLALGVDGIVTDYPSAIFPRAAYVKNAGAASPMSAILLKNAGAVVTPVARYVKTPGGPVSF